MTAARRALWVLFPVLVAGLLYGSTVRNGWFLDDWKLFTNAVWSPGRYTASSLGPLDAWTTLPGFFIDDPAPSAARYTRPLTDMYYLVLRGWTLPGPGGAGDLGDTAGFSPGVVHLGNVVVHGAICGLLAATGLLAPASVRPAALRFSACCGLVLSVHSATAYVVPWCADACDILALGCCLLALVAAEASGPRALVAYSVLLGAALFTKESTAPLLLVAPALAWLAGRRAHAGQLLLVGLVDAALYAPWYASRVPAPPTPHAGTPAQVALSWLPILTSWPTALSKSGFVGQLHPSDAWRAVAGALLLGAVALGVVRLRSARTVAWAVVGAAVAWVGLTVPGAAGGLGGFLCARYVYIPLGVSLAVLALRLPAVGSTRALNVGAVALLALVALNLPRTLRLLGAWQTEADLWAEEASYGGDSLALFQFARVRFAQQRDADGVDAWMQGMAALPEDAHAPDFEPSPRELAEVASHALALHRPTDAIALMDYRRASSRPMPENGPSWCVIAEAHRQLGQLDPSADARCRAR